MKELDLMMESYLENEYSRQTLENQQTFQKLLTYQDPQILDLLFGRIQDDDPKINELINALKNKTIH